MKRRLTLLFLATTITFLMPIGNSWKVLAGDHERGCAIQSPLDSPDPPGKNAAGDDAIGHKGAFYPYWNPLVPISMRWNYSCVIPHYSGICRWGLFHSEPCCGTSEGPEVAAAPAVPGATYGIFTGSPHDEAALLHLGGSGHGLPRVKAAASPAPAKTAEEEIKPSKIDDSDEPKKSSGKTQQKGSEKSSEKSKDL